MGSDRLSLRRLVDDEPLDPSTAPLAAAGWLGRALSWRPRRHRALNLALQGGGAHGAFTWGVLDRLLAQPGLTFPAVSGTSAGAVNAVVLASGLLEGGPETARARLHDLWHGVAEAARPLQQGGLFDVTLDAATQLLSPYTLNPWGLHPLEGLLDRLVDFERLRRDTSITLLIAATKLGTGAARIFGNAELCRAAVMASTCLPWLHHAVELDGEAYWDGGYTSNPPVLPLIERSPTRDTLLVRIAAGDAVDRPRTAAAIRRRIGHIVFEQPLERELELLAARRRQRRGLDARRRRITSHRLHTIDGRPTLATFPAKSRLLPDWPTLRTLHQKGHDTTDAWLQTAGRRFAL